MGQKMPWLAAVRVLNTWPSVASICSTTEPQTTPQQRRFEVGLKADVFAPKTWNEPPSRAMSLAAQRHGVHTSAGSWGRSTSSSASSSAPSPSPASTRSSLLSPPPSPSSSSSFSCQALRLSCSRQRRKCKGGSSCLPSMEPRNCKNTSAPHGPLDAIHVSGCLLAST